MKAGEILKKILDEKGINQKELSQTLNLAESTTSRFLSGKLKLRQKNLETMLNYLKLTKIEELEIWKAWTLDGGEPKAVAYFEKLDKENKKLKKILSAIKEL